MFVEKLERFHHPRVEAVGGMLRDLAHDVGAVGEPAKFAARRDRKYGGIAVLAAITVLRYCFAIESDCSFRVVWKVASDVA